MYKLACFSALSVLTLVACGDATSSTGEEGRLRYTLFTDYDVPAYELTDARIVTGHEQRILVGLTAEGQRDVVDAARISHQVVPPTAAVSISQESGSETNPPDIVITVLEAGSYTVESTEAGELVDRIELTFDRPGSFEMLTQVRDPWTNNFVSAEGSTITVEEGTQVTFQAVPLDDAGERLAGDMQTTVSLDPMYMAVPGQGVLDTFEDGVWSVGGEVNFYFIEPGLATFTVIDPVSEAIGSQEFEVTPVPVP